MLSRREYCNSYFFNIPLLGDWEWVLSVTWVRWNFKKEIGLNSLNQCCFWDISVRLVAVLNHFLISIPFGLHDLCLWSLSDGKNKVFLQRLQWNLCILFSSLDLTFFFKCIFAKVVFSNHSKQFTIEMSSFNCLIVPSISVLYFDIFRIFSSSFTYRQAYIWSKLHTRGSTQREALATQNLDSL